MVALPSWLATAAAFLPLLSIANAELSQELRDRKLPDCKANTRYSEIEDMGTFWYDSGAEQFANDYINSQTDHTRWAQNLMRELLDTNDYTKFDCETTGATCSTADELCGKHRLISTIYPLTDCNRDQASLTKLTRVVFSTSSSL